MRRTLSVVTIIGCAAASVLAAGAPRARAVTTAVRYASPTGSATNPCTKPKPCDLKTAINSAPSPSIVYLQSATYGSKTAPYDSPLFATAQIDVQGGSPGVTRPATIWSESDGYGLALTAAGSSATNVVIHLIGPELSLSALYLATGTTGEHVIATTVNTTEAACADSGMLFDSVCVDSTPNGTALGLSTAGGTSLGTAVGVDAFATGTGSTGVSVSDQGSGGTSALAITDSIIRGQTHDVAAIATGDSAATVTLSHSDFRPSTDDTTSPDPAEIVTNSTDIATAPKFVNPTAGNFAERSGSPTVDAGITVKREPTTDLARNPRVLGAAQDIGAYEFLAKPVLGTPTAKTRTATAVSVAESVNPEGLPTKVRLVAVRHGKKVSGRAVSAGSKRSTRTLHPRVHGLKPGTTYTIYVVATSKSGPVSSKKRTVRTKT